MTRKMLIDATHPEETRVAIVQGNKLEDFDFESAARQQLVGNIYLAKVTRVEPSLQAAFVEYGGNRHGFLAFNEIHPDYYQIPIADRQALLDADAAEEQRAEDADEDVSFEPAEPDGAIEDLDEVSEIGGDQRIARRASPDAEDDGATDPDSSKDDSRDADPPVAESQSQDPMPMVATGGDSISSEPLDEADTGLPEERIAESIPGPVSEDEVAAPIGMAPADSDTPTGIDETGQSPETAELGATLAHAADSGGASSGDSGRPRRRSSRRDDKRSGGASGAPVSPAQNRHGGNERRDKSDWHHERRVESVGGEDALDEVSRPRSRRRQYKIQEVIKNRQILLVQVLKDERGSKGAALTTYLSIPGRYCVLMPNTARGGGISRKISNAPDRKRLKAVAAELDVPEGMGLIIRTAGANRTKAEIKRDFEYLLRQWETIRELTLRSSAPCLINEEGSIIKRAVRDLYDKDIENILVEGEPGYREAKDFMRMLMPSHAKKVQPYREPVPLFQSYQIEKQLDSMFDPTVRLKSGGYIVINPTEALVSIDVNSGKATREANIEATALRTNLEAAEEVSRQLRLRDLAGLIVIDFIDMDNPRNDRAVERKLKDCLATDRARIQVGRISPFGLLEMSRQRLRQGVVETTTRPCPHCTGTGLVRSVDSLALHVLRGVEEEALRKRHQAFDAKVPADVAIYILNQKRDWLAQIEIRFGISVFIIADADMQAPNFDIKPSGREVAPGRMVVPLVNVPEIEEDDPEIEPETEAVEQMRENPATEEKPRRRQRGRARGAERNARTPDAAVPGMGPQPDVRAPAAAADAGEVAGTDGAVTGENGSGPRRRRRRRRGGRERGAGMTVALASADVAADDPASESGIYAGAGAPNDAVVIPILEVPVLAASEPEPWPALTDNDTAPEQPAKASEISPLPVERAEYPVIEPEPVPEAEPVQSEGPKRGGWWQRRFGGA